MELLPHQVQIVASPLTAKMFLHGPAGTGKTTAATARLLALLEAGIPGESILVLVPQRTLGLPYSNDLYTAVGNVGGVVSIVTVGGLAQRMVELFWPIVAASAGFSFPNQPPVFLTLESAQYYMAQLVRPLLEQGFFDSVVMDRNRLYSQIIDNLNKAAVVGFAYTEIGQRLKAAWEGDAGQARIYEDAQHCASQFRQFCLANNLLDFSLQLETFLTYVWPNPICKDYLTQTYRHLIVDNIEEDTPIAHDILSEWLLECESALVVYDEIAGYRRFLGADPESAAQLAEIMPERIRFNRSMVMDVQIEALQQILADRLAPEAVSRYTTLLEENKRIDVPPDRVQGWSGVLTFEPHRYFPRMLDWVSDQIADLVKSGAAPGEIAILSPFLSDALRFSLVQRLDSLGIPSRSHRPSRSLREEPVTQCLFTLSLIAHPQWYIDLPQGITPTRFDFAYALMQIIEGLDLVRAQLLAEIIYRVRENRPAMGSFDPINPEMQERITYTVGERYEALRLWLEAYIQGPEQELDYFLSRLFGEILSQPGFSFHNNYRAGEITANLIESIQKFRWSAAGSLNARSRPLGLEYLEMVQDGVIAAQYIRSWQTPSEDAVWIAPAYTFLMSNRPVDYQFWLDIGNRSWSERLYQPLTHPYVLSRRWPDQLQWTDLDEVQTSQDALFRLVTGLVRRCRHGIFLGLSDLGEQGYEQRGPLLRTFQHVLRQARSE